MATNQQLSNLTALTPARSYVARLADLSGARFYGHGPTAAEARKQLGAAVGAWDEECEERSQQAWQGLEDVLREVLTGPKNSPKISLDNISLQV